MHPSMSLFVIKVRIDVAVCSVTWANLVVDFLSWLHIILSKQCLEVACFICISHVYIWIISWWHDPLECWQEHNRLEWPPFATSTDPLQIELLPSEDFLEYVFGKLWRFKELFFYLCLDLSKLKGFHAHSSCTQLSHMWGSHLINFEKEDMCLTCNGWYFIVFLLDFVKNSIVRLEQWLC